MPATDSDTPPEYESGLDRVYLQGTTPTIRLEMAIDSPVWHLNTGNDGRPKLVFTITSHFDHPITLRILGSILDRRRVYNGLFIQQRFSITDVDTGQRLCFSGSQPHYAYSPGRQLGRDEAGYLTLYPNDPITVSYGVPCLSYNERFDGGADGSLEFAPRAAEYGGELFRRYFEPGHRYSIAIQDRFKRRCRDKPPEREDYQVSFWWRYGTKEEVMAAPGPTPGGSDIGWSEKRIELSGIPPVELAIEESPSIVWP